MKMPPLHALMCFESAARLMSMKAAADELCVTSSAVSQQIAKLESMTNSRLFIRSPRRLELTTEGRIYLRAIRPAFNQIAEATQRLMNEGKANKVTVSCTSGFAINGSCRGCLHLKKPTRAWKCKSVQPTGRLIYCLKGLISPSDTGLVTIPGWSLSA